MEKVIDKLLQDNDELTARQIRSKLEEQFSHLRVSLAVKRVRRQNGWVCRGTRPHYCQLICEVNKGKRLAWCQQQLNDEEQFENVLFTDECTVQLDYHGRLCFRKQKQPRALKQLRYIFGEEFLYAVLLGLSYSLETCMLSGYYTACAYNLTILCTT